MLRKSPRSQLRFVKRSVMTDLRRSMILRMPTMRSTSDKMMLPP